MAVSGGSARCAWMKILTTTDHYTNRTCGARRGKETTRRETSQTSTHHRSTSDRLCPIATTPAERLSNCLQLHQPHQQRLPLVD
ncbi:uncharacterized protein CANTADRAFT_141385 [Suhomyces tanzawaensis NRRL Y-17324]|uniref:Uncharacterized protein n=1 Tax=Suhomyces tanzawaensis NRRL Y-17324 TaxID=984487 RepID=A0A1E4SS38_9ASCO|nr:uncharacterized protein CANTADRAFT_141385 [Suhomyces tanzawaensis NRRL Y-17324]ODV82333.1 hypothetical protein CANTADRAFT_141385 [Suhomyces tanzawaensis NRRL Y-17324]